MSSWKNISLTKCLVAKMSSWQNVKLKKHLVDQISTWHNVKLTKCLVDKMSSRQNDVTPKKFYNIRPWSPTSTLILRLIDWLIPSDFCSITSCRGSFGRTLNVRTPSGPLCPFEIGGSDVNVGWYVVGVIGGRSSTDDDVVVATILAYLAQRYKTFYGRNLRMFAIS